jgi:hypothetical protein
MKAAIFLVLIIQQLPPMNLLDLIQRAPEPLPWDEGEKIPWDERGFSERMLLRLTLPASRITGANTFTPTYARQILEPGAIW